MESRTPFISVNLLTQYRHSELSFPADFSFPMVATCACWNKTSLGPIETTHLCWNGMNHYLCTRSTIQCVQIQIFRIYFLGTWGDIGGFCELLWCGAHLQFRLTCLNFWREKTTILQQISLIGPIKNTQAPLLAHLDKLWYTSRGKDDEANSLAAQDVQVYN